MNPALYTTCAYCPRLCRHVCPVAVATGAEAATPSAMMTMPLLAARDALSPADALRGTSLCLGCGACTAHCKYEVPVAERLQAFRAQSAALPVATAPIRVEGDAPLVCVITGDHDWSAAWSGSHGVSVAILRTADSLGHAAWRHGEPGVVERVAERLAGRELVTGSGAVEEVARAAGLPVRRLPTPEAAEPREFDGALASSGSVEFHTCYAGPRPGPGQLACCGRREGFPGREPEAARQVAVENVRLFAGAAITCADEECASWLRAHGARIVGPMDSTRGSDDG